VILIISTCFDKLHELEFIRPINDIVGNCKIINYKDLDKNDLQKYSHIIISGTALIDNDYMNYFEDFSWIKNWKKPLLGICAGAQIIAKVFGEKIVNKQEIGLIKVDKKKDDKLLENVNLNEIFSLHNYVFNMPKDFEVLLENNIVQLCKKDKIYACLFHCEVRNKKLIENFILI
jgi:GMP synthase (glutamine-hydrolysing)